MLGTAGMQVCIYIYYTFIYSSCACVYIIDLEDTICMQSWGWRGLYNIYIYIQSPIQTCYYSYIIAQYIAVQEKKSKYWP